MFALPLLLLLHALQDESVEKLAKDVVAKDPAASKKLAMLGAKAVRPLLLQRGRWSGEDLERLNEAIVELKASSDPVESHAAIYQNLRSQKISLEFKEVTLEKLAGLVARVTGVEIVVDPAQIETLGNKVLACKIAGITMTEALDVFASQTGADWAVRYGAVVFASPSRLWPETPKEPRKLTDAERKEVDDLIARLGSDSIEEREKAAARIRELGAGASDRIAKAAASERDAEVASRCKAILAEWAPGDGAPLGDRCGVDGQNLAGADKDLLEKLRSDKTTFKIRDLSLYDMVRLLSGARKLDIVLDGKAVEAGKKVKLSLEFTDAPVYTILATATRSMGFDFYIKDGRVIVAPSAEIRKIVDGK